MSKSLAISYSMKKKKKASGGTVESGDKEMNYAKGGKIPPKKEKEPELEVEEVDPAMEVVCPKCEHSFSHGGQVANDTDFLADTLPNEFDDLVLRDDEEMKGYTGKNSGDDIGGPDKDDLVARAMLKRKKK